MGTGYDCVGLEAGFVPARHLYAITSNSLINLRGAVHHI